MPLKATIKGTEVLKDSSGAEVLHALDPHGLVMAAGYFKYMLAKENHEVIYFRGQRKLYGSLSPGLYRGLKTYSSQEKRHQALTKVVTAFRESGNIFKSFGKYAHEPLLQHYGISTTWIDLVDNVWIALWFACHRAMVAGKSGEFVHFERRRPSAVDKYAYILLVACDIVNPNAQMPGYFSGSRTESIDLRVAAPSIFLRPHSQHALLFRRKTADGQRPLDYADQIRRVVRIDLDEALRWLGDGSIVSTHSVFPPPFYDDGYRILLTSDVPVLRAVGSITHIGA